MMIRNFFFKKKLFILGLIIALLIAFLDLYSKNLVFCFLDKISANSPLQHSEFVITRFFNLVKVRNNGVSFGMLSGLACGKYIILSINLGILLALLIWLYRNKIAYLTFAIALIIGGAIGNIVDRVWNNAVADFLDFHLFGYHWPAFNLADSAVFLGVVLLLLENYFVKPNKNKYV